MRDIRRFFNRISVKMIMSIIFLVTLLTVIVGFFRYQVFTRTMLNRVASNLGNIADNAEIL